MPTLTVTLTAANVTRVINAFKKRDAFAPPMEGDGEAVVIDQAFVEKWMKEQLQAVVHEQERNAAVNAIAPPAPIA